MNENYDKTPGEIFIVDDTQANLDLLTSILSRNGYSIRTATHGLEAIAQMQHQPPDLVLLDVMLPEMNGYDVCLRLKAMPQMADVPVIFISALNEVDNIIRAFKSGGVDYLTKPFKHLEILARVQTHLEMKRLREHDRDLIEQLSQEIQRREEAEEEALRLALESERKNILAQFIQNVSHEFKTPLQIIGTRVYLVDRLAQNPQLREHLDIIHEQAENIEKLVEAMVTMARLDGQPRLSRQPSDLNHITQTVVQELKPLVDQYGHRLEFFPRCENPVARVDVADITMAIRNLLRNAILFTPAGGGILVETFCDEHTVAVAIEDNGAGMSAEVARRVFDRFYREDSAHSTRGFGLGLSIARSIVEHHKGSIDLQTEKGVGSRFTILLPRG